MKNVALHNLGCKVNSYEMDVMQQNLLRNGFLIVPFDEVADIYIVNTCTVTNVADQKSRKMLHRARQKNPDAIVVAVGCFVQVEYEALIDSSIDLAIGNNKKNQLVPILNEYLKNRPAQITKTSEKFIIDINRETSYEEMTLNQIAGHTRAFIKIQDGCNQFCSYCIIPYVRGRVRSRPAEAVISELTGLVNDGCREIVLTGINLSSYGSDFSEKDALTNLLTKLHNIPGLHRIRLGSLEPRIISRDFIQKIAALPKICPHFHLSLQSGSDTVLQRMNRRYNTAEYDEKVEIIRAEYMNRYGMAPAITTDIIVGFPGETEAEFNETENFVRKIGFSEIHVFKYSKRKGTKAAVMPNQISAAGKKGRSLRLHEIGKNSAKQFMTFYLDKKVSIILEEIKVIDQAAYWLGYTAEYLRIAVPQKDFAINNSGQLISGLLVNAVVTGFLTEEILIGSIELYI
ncbi:MAG: tRNA (N(6)-L-threonylcarbamoyladenosine(37)-C(2))-methylthiotransferase MtaB [Lachnospiraceae bacterium]|nr:tRNA (N(6)-L-threonylcarbamoyladenosine(37)-C(2))-methylthiotransferase MtaB [Lachnospiraceae bacterium]